jgi:hypothetical protein
VNIAAFTPDDYARVARLVEVLPALSEDCAWLAVHLRLLFDDDETRAEQLDARNGWLVRGAALTGKHSAHARARELRARFQRSVRHRVDLGVSMPSQFQGTLDECIWHLARLDRAGVAFPGDRQLRAILGNVHFQFPTVSR